MDRGAWQATVRGIRSWTRLSAVFGKHTLVTLSLLFCNPLRLQNSQPLYFVLQGILL